MRAAVFHEAGQPLTIETIPDPVPAGDEVVIAVHGAGICGSDLHITQHAGITRPGTVLGHEFAGTIAALGAGVTGGWKVGDRVTALPLFPCCACEACDAHMPNLCAHGNWAGVTPERPGAYAEYVIARGSLLQAVPAGIADAEAAMKAAIQRLMPSLQQADALFVPAAADTMRCRPILSEGLLRSRRMAKPAGSPPCRAPIR